MKRLALVFLLCALAVPAAALAAPRDKSDGTLAVKDARGMIVLTARGTVIGRVGTGAITVVDSSPFGDDAPQVLGYDSRQVDPTNPDATIYKGTSMRFRYFGGAYKLTFVGRGIDIVAVGQGRVRFPVVVTSNDGRFALDGNAFQDVPSQPFTATFGGTSSSFGG